jgi:hypothetical protein
MHLVVAEARDYVEVAPGSRTGEALLKGYEPLRYSCGVAWMKEADEPLPGLCTRDPWPSSGGSRKCAQEVTPPHSITSSARERSEGGTLMPSALAVAALTTSSNVVGCSTGRSFADVPFKTVATKRAMRTHMPR